MNFNAQLEESIIKPEKSSLTKNAFRIMNSRFVKVTSLFISDRFRNGLRGYNFCSLFLYDKDLLISVSFVVFRLDLLIFAIIGLETGVSNDKIGKIEHIIKT